MAQVVFPAVVVPGSTADPAEPVSPTDGQIWVDTDGTAPTTVVTRWSKTPTNGTTTLSGTDDTTNTLAYTPGYEQVFLNGVLLSRGSDYTATNGTSVVLVTATVTSDIVEIIAALQVAYTDTITTAAAATTYVAKALTTTTGDIIYASAANTPARLGIGSSAQVLSVSGGIPAWTTASTEPYVGVSCYIQGTSIAYTDSVARSLPFVTESFDTNTFHDNSTNTTRITIPSGYSGKYLIDMSFGCDTAGTFGNINLYKNGANITTIGVDGGKVGGASGMTSNYFVARANPVISLTAGDYIEFYITFSSTATTGTYARFGATFLGA